MLNCSNKLAFRYFFWMKMYRRTQWVFFGAGEIAHNHSALQRICARKSLFLRNKMTFSLANYNAWPRWWELNILSLLYSLTFQVHGWDWVKTKYLSTGQSELAPTNAPVGRSVHRMGCVFSFGAGWGSSQSISFCCWPLYFFFLFFLVPGRFSWTWPHTYLPCSLSYRHKYCTNLLTQLP